MTHPDAQAIEDHNLAFEHLQAERDAAHAELARIRVAAERYLDAISIRHDRGWTTLGINEVRNTLRAILDPRAARTGGAMSAKSYWEDRTAADVAAETNGVCIDWRDRMRRAERERAAAQAELARCEERCVDYQLERDDETLTAGRAERELARLRDELQDMIASLRHHATSNSVYVYQTAPALADELRAILDPAPPEEGDSHARVH